MLLLRRLALLLLPGLQLIWAQETQAPFRNEDSSIPLLRVAVIGAGAAGSSFAYHLTRFQDQLNLDTPINLTVFEINPRAGGRTTTVNALGLSSQPVEVGASIFVEINQILYGAAQDFGLLTDRAFNVEPGTAKYGLGVWDGREFVFKQTNDEEDDVRAAVDWRGWWDVAKLLWRYGLSPIRTRSATKDAVAKFLRMYQAPIFPFHNLTRTVNELGLLDYTRFYGSDLLTAKGISEPFQRQVIQASTRVNYAQNLNQIHGLEAMVCMSTDGAVSVEGGNWQIFEKMIQASGADFRRNTTVSSVKKTKDNTFTLHSRGASMTHGDLVESPAQGEFDAVILAAPYHSSNIDFDPPPRHIPSIVPYVDLHVTLFTSPHCISPAHFNLSDPSEVPSMILTTLPVLDQNQTVNSSGTPNPGPASIWSISTLRIINLPNQRRQYLYKIFSPHPLTGKYLSSLLGIPNLHSNISTSVETETETETSTEIDTLISLSTTNPQDLTWHHEKHWKSYPYLSPISSFDSISLSTGGRPGGGIWYTSGIERFISTMETSALMGRNVARLIVDELSWHPEQCRPWEWVPERRAEWDREAEEEAEKKKKKMMQDGCEGSEI